MAFACVFGLLLGIGLLKFGNPVTLDRLVDWPTSLIEWRIFAWPIRVGYALLVVVGILGLFVIGERWKTSAPGWIMAALALWIGAQLLAAVSTTVPDATPGVLAHFLACASCFLLGHLALSRSPELRVFWLCLVAGFVGVLGMAFEQQFGGLEATRRMILESTNAASLSPEYLARIQSRRVFSTLVYPNALAGAILLLLPLAVTMAARGGARWGTRGAFAAGAAMLIAGFSVLMWSGSKAGWLLAMGMGLILLLHSPFPVRWRIALASAITIGGLIAFGVLYAERLSRGATSVAARFDYWTAALQGFAERPVLGHGPGAFRKVYARLKAPESEMAQLAHNDYLQQAVDSGIAGFLGYAVFVWGSMFHLYRRRRALSPLERVVGLGLLGWFAQGFVEFGLYIPATAWCAFSLLGWLLATCASREPSGPVEFRPHAGVVPERAEPESPRHA